MKLIVALVTVVPILFAGILLILSARTRRGVLFSVSVPLDCAESSRGRRVLFVYRVLVTSLTVIGAAATLLGTMRQLAVLVVAGPLLLVVGSLATFVLLRRAIKPVAISAPMERRAEFGASPRRANWWLAATVAAMVPLIASWLYVRAHFNEVPDRFPVRWDAAGNVVSWMHRSQAALALPGAVGACSLLLLIGISVFQRTVSTVNRPRAQRILMPGMAALAWSFTVVFSLLTLLPLNASVALPTILSATALHLTLVLAISIWLIHRQVQWQRDENYDSTPDKAWRAGGLIYYNPADAAVLVPKRFGWGWTLNMAHPASWAFFGFVLLIPIFATLLPHLLR